MKSIGILQIIMIIMSSVGLINHVFIIPMLLDHAGRDAWVSVILVTLPFLVWCSLLYFVMKKSSQQHLIAWIQSAYGTFVAMTIAVVASIYLFFSAVITVQDTVTWAVTSYLPETPRFVLILSLILLCYITSIQGLRVISVMAGILLPGIVALGFFVMGSNIPNKDYTRLLPILEHGWNPVFSGMIICGAGLVELTILLFMQQYLTRPIRYWQLMILALILVGLTLGPVTGGIAEFGVDEMSRLRYPAFEEWKLIIIAKNVERLDFLSIYQWMAGAFLRISTAMFLIHELLNRLHTYSVVKFLLPFYIVLGIISTLPLTDVFFYRIITKIYLPTTLITLSVLTVLIALLAWKFKPRRITHD